MTLSGTLHAQEWEYVDEVECGYLGEESIDIYRGKVLGWEQIALFGVSPPPFINYEVRLDSDDFHPTTTDLATILKRSSRLANYLESYLAVGALTGGSVGAKAVAALMIPILGINLSADFGVALYNHWPFKTFADVDRRPGISFRPIELWQVHSCLFKILFKLRQSTDQMESE